MKLILKRIKRARVIGAGSIQDDVVFNDGHELPGPFALHTEDGQILPLQASTSMESDHTNVVRLIVTFVVDGDKIRIEGDVCEPAN